MKIKDVVYSSTNNVVYKSVKNGVNNKKTFYAAGNKEILKKKFKPENT